LPFYVTLRLIATLSVTFVGHLFDYPVTTFVAFTFRLFVAVGCVFTFAFVTFAVDLRYVDFTRLRCTLRCVCAFVVPLVGYVHVC